MRECTFFLLFIALLASTALCLPGEGGRTVRRAGRRVGSSNTSSAGGYIRPFKETDDYVKTMKRLDTVLERLKKKNPDLSFTQRYERALKELKIEPDKGPLRQLKVYNPRGDEMKALRAAREAQRLQNEEEQARKQAVGPEEDEVPQKEQTQEALRPIPPRPLPWRKAAEAEAPARGQSGPGGQGADTERPGLRQQPADVQKSKAPNPVSHKQRTVSQQADGARPVPEQPNSDFQRKKAPELRRPVWQPRAEANRPKSDRDAGRTRARLDSGEVDNEEPIPQLLPRPQTPSTLLGKKLQEALSGKTQSPDENRLSFTQQVLALATRYLNPFQEGSARGPGMREMPPVRRLPMRGLRF
ncbi:MAG: hypothetical protein M1815_003971 [Lichina confinis]|nr:MAG: hypothetical protein M1815_003971 [Lichina confinis]